MIGRRALLGAAGGGVLAGGAALVAAPAVRAQAGGGVALVIGNSKYQWEASLPNVRRDAPDIAKRFQAMGLKTELVQDVGRPSMQAAIDKFGAASKGAKLAAFYFAGHGAAWGRANYIVPADADLGTPDAAQTLTPVMSIASAASEAANRLVILDACRNNPSDGWRQLQTQRSAVVNTTASATFQQNSLVMYSTAPGRVALDGPAGQNSPFAASLMRQLDGDSVDLYTLPARLRRDLLIATEGKQVLWDINTYSGSIALKGARLSDAPNKSAWAGDPSKIVDLANAYAFARDNKFPLPEGLIAHRPARASRDARMIGSFKYVSRFKNGNWVQMLIVMSVEEGSTVELIMAGLSERGPFWRFVAGQRVDGRLEFVPRDGSAKSLLTWSDANSGTFAQLPDGNVGQDQKPYTTTFTRLDG